VAREFVAVTQAFGVQYALVADRDRVVERGAERHAGFPQPLDILDETEGARPRQLAAKRLAREIESRPLTPNDRAFEIDLDVDLQASDAGRELRERGAVPDSHFPQHLDVAPARRKLKQ